MKPPAFQLYAADFYMDTAGWTPTQVGAYLRLLLHEWINGPLPKKISALARIAGCDPRNMQKMWSAELSKKFITDDANMYINLRLERTREEQAEYRENQRSSGLRGVEAKKKKGIFPFNKPSDPLTDPTSDPATGNQALQSSSSISSNNIVKEVVFYLNEKTKKNFKYTTNLTIRHIKARVAEKYIFDDFKKVIDIKVAEWGKNPKMMNYLRPETLFGTKFESYLQEVSPVKEVWKDDQGNIVDHTSTFQSERS